MKRTRRALTDEELRRLVAGSDWRGLVYFTAARTGLRQEELRQLIWDDLRLEEDVPYVRVRVVCAKNKTEEQVALVQAQPDYGPLLCVLGLIDAMLGRKEEALREGRRAIELLPAEKDSIDGSRMLVYFAIIAAWVGEKDLAVQYLAGNGQSQGGYNVATYGALKLLLFWDPLRGDPRFEKIVASLAPKQ